MTFSLPLSSSLPKVSKFFTNSRVTEYSHKIPNTISLVYVYRHLLVRTCLQIKLLLFYNDDAQVLYKLRVGMYVCKATFQNYTVCNCTSNPDNLPPLLLSITTLEVNDSN